MRGKSKDKILFQDKSVWEINEETTEGNQGRYCFLMRYRNKTWMSIGATSF
jgi:hypothetical protein